MIEKYLSMYRWTSIGRPVWPGYDTNLAILLIAVIAATVAGSLRLVRSGGDIGASLATGIFMGFTVFIAWSLTREADIEHNGAAFVSAGVAFVLSILWNVPSLNLIGLAGVIVFLRLIDRVVGPPFRWIDTLGSFAFVLFLAWQGDWVLVLFFAGGYLLDSMLQPEPFQRHIPFAVVAAGVGVYVMAQHSIAPLFLSLENVIVCGLAVLGFLVFFLTRRTVRVVTDAPGYNTSMDRIRAAMLWLALMGIAFMLLGGDAGVKTLVPLWGMFAGPPLYALWQLYAARSQQSVLQR